MKNQEGKEFKNSQKINERRGKIENTDLGVKIYGSNRAETGKTGIANNPQGGSP
jgi:hypothetical protein